MQFASFTRFVIEAEAQPPKCAHAWREYLIALIAVLFVLVPLWPAYEAAALAMDEGSLLVYPELMMHGKLPYKDFETYYGPANLWVLSGAYSLFGTNIAVERSVGLFYRLLVLGAIFCFGRRCNFTMAIGGLLLAGFLMLPLALPAYAWMGGVASGLWSIYLLNGALSRKRIFFAGVLAATALVFRPDLGIAVILSALPFVILNQGSERFAYVSGGVSGLIPLAALTIMAGPQNVFSNLFLYPVMISNAGRKLPLASADGFLVSLTVLHILSACFIIGSGWLVLRGTRENARALSLVSVGLFSLGLTHQAIQRIDILHVLFAAFLSIAVLPFAIIQMVETYGRLPVSRSQMLLVVAAVVIAVESLCPQLVFFSQREFLNGLALTEEKSILVKQDNRFFPVDSASTAMMTARLLTRLNESAKPGERLFVGPRDLRRTNNADTFFYHLLPTLTPASYFLEMNPLSANRPNSRLAADIQTADWLILDDVWDTWKEPNASSRFGPSAPLEVVANQFAARGTFGHYELFQRKENAPGLAALKR